MTDQSILALSSNIGERVKTTSAKTAFVGLTKSELLTLELGLSSAGIYLEQKRIVKKVPKKRDKEKLTNGDTFICENRAPVKPEQKKPRLQNEWLLFIIFLLILYSILSASKFTATSRIPIANPPNISEIKNINGLKVKELQTSAKPRIGTPKHITNLNPRREKILSANSSEIWTPIAGPRRVSPKAVSPIPIWFCKSPILGKKTPKQNE